MATPIFCITLAPSPKKRIFRPLRSSTDLISLRNQPDASGAMVPHSMDSMLYLRVSSCISCSPPPKRIQPMYSPISGPNGTAENSAMAMSLPVKKPRPVHAESSEPLEIASKYWLAGTSAPGSKNRMSIDPAESFLTLSAK